MSIEDIKRKIMPVLQSYGVKRVGVFGSAARGETKKESDVDILVEIDKDISLIEFIKLKMLLEESLGKRVDLVEYSALKPSLKNKILREQVQLL